MQALILAGTMEAAVTGGSDHQCLFAFTPWRGSAKHSCAVLLTCGAVWCWLLLPALVQVLQQGMSDRTLEGTPPSLQAPGQRSCSSS